VCGSPRSPCPNRLRIVNRLIQFFLGDVLNILVEVRTRFSPGSGCSQRRKTLAARVHRVNILPARPRSSSSNACSMPLWPTSPSPPVAHHLRRQIARRNKNASALFENEYLQVQRLVRSMVSSSALRATQPKSFVIVAIGQHYVVILTGDARDERNRGWKVFHFGRTANAESTNTDIASSCPARS